VRRSAVLLVIGSSLCSLAGCGARAELIVQRGPISSPPDVLGTDASRTDAGDITCSLGPIVVLKRRMEPSFLLSMTAIEGGGYAFTMASGWMGFASPALVVLDQDLQEMAATATPRLEVVHAIQGVRRLFTVTSERDPTRNAPVDSAFYELSPRLERESSTSLCMDCVVRDRPAAQRAGQIALSMSTQVLDNGGVMLVDATSRALVGRAFAADLRAPSVLAVSQGWYAISQSSMNGALSRALFSEPLTNARALQPVARGFDGNDAPWLVRVDSTTIAAVGMARATGSTVPITMATWESDRSLEEQPSLARTVGTTGPTAQGLSACARMDLRLVAIAWGEQLGDNGGAWVTVVDARARPVLAPQSASEPVANSQSYTIFTAVVPHPEGFVVAWNGWQRQANYAIYARLVRCH
jgi:hypothetical protein